MTIKELREMVNSIPAEMDNCPVYLQTDPEGNGYREVSGIDTNSAFKKESQYETSVISLDNTPYDNCLEPEEQEELAKTQRCALVFP